MINIFEYNTIDWYLFTFTLLSEKGPRSLLLIDIGIEPTWPQSTVTIVNIKKSRLPGSDDTHL